MWKIERIKAKNIVSFKELDYSIQHGVATLIFGENLDGTDQKHNGSGKSALIEAISLALTGDYLRDIKTTEELINDSADSCSVEITLSNTFNNIVMTIKRVLFRKEAQRVEVHQYLDEEEVNVDRTVQPSVNDYNKLILNEIGLSKDDIFSNYILCRNRYVSFLSAKDKDKKDLINRFSNGVMVDNSIEALLLDMKDVEEVVSEKHDNVIRFQARIDTINEQITNAEQNRQKALQSKAERIAGLEEKIAEKRKEIRETKLEIEKANRRLDHIDKVVGDELDALEKSDKSLSQCFLAISELFANNRLQQIDNVTEQSDKLRSELDSLNGTLSSLNNSIANAEKNVVTSNKMLEAIKKEHNDLIESNGFKTAEDKRTLDKCDEDITKYENEIAKCEKCVSEYQDKLEDSMKEIEELKVKLHGVITCPNCTHKFVLNSDRSVEDLNDDLKTESEHVKNFNDVIDGSKKTIEKLKLKKQGVQDDICKLEQKIRGYQKEIDNHEANVRSAMRDVSNAQGDVEEFKSNIDRVSNKIKSINERLGSLRKNMFDNAFDVIDSTISRGENYIKGQNDIIKIAEEAISQYEDSIVHLKKSDEGIATELLENQIKEYQKKLADAQSELDEVTGQYNTLKIQKEHFIQFKTYLANTKIDAISKIINSFLEEIGSDIRVNIEGFRVLKSGKLSEKITVNLLRDGIECGAFGKFSGGEKSRVELASVLAIQTLINAGCEDGKGLDFLALDEILEACDESGISAACDTLNKLRKTALVITQNPIEENYPYRLVVTKLNGTSTIN